MDIVLVPGLWLDGTSWDLVVPHLQKAGHNTHPLTLPGLESAETDRSGIHVTDLIAAVTTAIDDADGRVLLVGHSMGCAIAGAALDARIDAVARVVYIGGWPTLPGRVVAQGFATDGADLPPAPWEQWTKEDVRGLDRASFEALLRPSPASLATEPFVLTDDRRYDLPAVFVCTEYTSQQLLGWVAEGLVAAVP